MHYTVASGCLLANLYAYPKALHVRSKGKTAAQFKVFILKKSVTLGEIDYTVRPRTIR